MEINILQLLTALGAGGIIVALINVIANLGKYRQDVVAAERKNLREDIGYLRSEVDNLRKEVAELRVNLRHVEDVIDGVRKVVTNENLTDAQARDEVIELVNLKE